MKSIFLVGFMGAGKSTVSTVLAKKLDLRAVEMDQEIERREGKTIQEIFDDKGEPYFRNRETKFLMDLAQEAPAVVSCGGGVCMRQDNVEVMKEQGTIVFLSATPETILARVKDSTDRPLLNGHMNMGFIKDLLSSRLPFYEEAADLTVETDGRKIEEICSEIMEKLPATD